jgi:H/ACA ribonucleoprotein complex subunit 4
VLPIALEDATKTVQAVLAGGKEYVGVMKLHGDVNYEEIIRVFKEFTGEIYQRPPLRSSVKRRVRTRIIYYGICLEFQGRNVLFKVGCQSGTYIRKYTHDIGEVLGVGAHMAELRRIRAGPYTENENLVRLQDLADAYYYWREKGEEEALRKLILPVETSVRLLPKVYVKDSAVEAICHGAHVAVPGIAKIETEINPEDLVAVMTLKGELVALAKAEMSTEQVLEAERGIALKTDRVIMPKGKYPKIW